MGKRRKNEYLAGDFISDLPPRRDETLEDVVDKKINLLYDFCALKESKQGHHTDPREPEVRRFLTTLGTGKSIDGAEDAMTTALHDVIRFEKTVEQMLDGR